jgi:hypothetical protein
MYNEKLDKLIEMALIDGELSEKEKQVLFKNAEIMGVDLDEFEMVLEAKLFERQKSIEQENPKETKAAPKSDKFGDIKKCPACGSMVQSFQIKCIDCGHEFSNIESNTSINKLFEMLNDAENERKDEGMSLGGIFAKALGGSDKVDLKKMTIISNFPIPNTKEDIIEFLSLAVPKSKCSKFQAFWKGEEGKKEMSRAKVWSEKCEQIIMKARFAMKDDKNTLDEINRYAKELKIKL